MFSSLNYPTYSTVEPRNYRPTFKGSPSIKVKILRSQMIFFKWISPLFIGEPEIKVKNLQSQWDRWGGVLLYFLSLTPRQTIMKIVSSCWLKKGWVKVFLNWRWFWLHKCDIIPLTQTAASVACWVLTAARHPRFTVCISACVSYNTCGTSRRKMIG